MTEETPICYRVNERDELIFVNDAWETFALANEGTGLASADVLQRPLFDFIADETTRLLYRDILRRVRAGYPVQFPFRCDAPAQRRWHEMTIILTEPGIVEFTTCLLRSEDRAIPSLFLTSSTPSAMLRMCSWCKRVEMGNQQWVELEEAVRRLNLFEQMQLPQVTHGICNRCLVSLKKSWGSALPATGTAQRNFASL